MNKIALALAALFLSTTFANAEGQKEQQEGQKEQQEGQEKNQAQEKQEEQEQAK